MQVRFVCKVVVPVRAPSCNICIQYAKTDVIISHFLNKPNYKFPSNSCILNALISAGILKSLGNLLPRGDWA